MVRGRCAGGREPGEMCAKWKLGRIRGLGPQRGAARDRRGMRLQGAEPPSRSLPVCLHVQRHDGRSALPLGETDRAHTAALIRWLTGEDRASP